MSGWALSDIERRLASVVRVATVSAADHAAKRVQVEAGGMVSAWLPWPAEAGRNYRRWRPLRVGQQVVIVSPSGDLGQAVIAGMLFGGGIDAPDTSPDVDSVEFEDGTRISYDSAAHALSVDCAGPVTISSAGTVAIDAANTTISGALTVGNGVSVTGDVTADGVSLKGHTHPESIGTTTGAPT